MMITSSDGLKSNTVFLAAKPQTFQHYIDDEGAGLGCGRRVCTLRKSVTMGSPNTYHVTIRYQTHHISKLLPYSVTINTLFLDKFRKVNTKKRLNKTILLKAFNFWFLKIYTKILKKHSDFPWCHNIIAVREDNCRIHK